MKPIMQTVFGADGNCMQACIASLLELSLDEVPQFPVHGQFLALERWLMPQSIRPVAFPVGKVRVHNVYYIGAGISPRGLRHAVVCKDSIIVHDPHPDNSGLDEHDIDYFFFCMFHKSSEMDFMLTRN